MIFSSFTKNYLINEFSKENLRSLCVIIFVLQTNIQDFVVTNQHIWACWQGTSEDNIEHKLCYAPIEGLVFMVSCNI